MAKRNLDEAVKRRVRAGRLLLGGKSPPEVARVVGAPRQTVYRWLGVLKVGGIDALRDMSKGGRPARLGAAELSRLYVALLEGATAHGFATPLWTLKRVRLWIEREFGVRYSEVHVWRLLGQLGLSNQKPDRRALDARQGRLIVFIDESGVSERPTRVRTWGVRGETPIVQFHFNWHQLSLIAGMHFTGLCFRLHEGSIAKEQVVAFLQALRAYFRRPLLIVWDNSRPHRSHLVRDYIASTAGRIQLHFLPGYAPELNPVEFLWGWLKRHALANFCPDTFAELQHTTRGKLKSAQRRSIIIASCWQQAELF